jgi:16S rRNA (adenine1518-N6/adenine1519-N6)-dimethyltransferase
VIEIGPGRGSLTASLLERAAQVVAIEVDTVLVHYLRQKFRDSIEEGRLEIIEGDVLKTDFAAIASRLNPPETGADLHPIIAGNLPYYITSPILEKVFSLGGAPSLENETGPEASAHAGSPVHTGWAQAVFLVQAEVAARIAAQPGGRDFGYLSVLAQVHAHVEELFPVSREAFHPPPKVESTVIRLTPRDAAHDFGILNVPGFLAFASACFRHKRKTLRNNLLQIFSADALKGLREAGMRAEQLGVPELADLYRRLNEISAQLPVSAGNSTNAASLHDA